ncbi:glycosyl transferase [Paenibacillus sp. J31TS4]|uniref:glycosyltransferase family 2 protein n=1 Tax=Paenibacillus sp. J31TS4 TaxID=2807195 RepID=UPI001AFDF720|nr:glycosyltransferase family 2 protein [Paenibacillus sp. J31TS4]GIP39955.1 glycosyl transferase [Paenibacillus sp. J31TS4]
MSRVKNGDRASINTVSVHIVTYNSAVDIEACLEAVLGQTYPLHEIVVVDNASQDETGTILQRYSDQVRIQWNAENTGFAPAHNQAIRSCSSKYFLVLNPDVVLHPDYVRCLIEALKESGPRIGSATGKLLARENPKLIDSTGLVMKKARRAFDRGAGTQEEQWAKQEEVFGVSGAAALYATNMARQISVEGEFFDEQFFAYKEDVDVAWRARLFGWSALYCPNAIAYHERGWKSGTRAKQSLRVRRFSYINRYRMIYKNDQWRYILRHLPSLLLYELLSFPYFLLREPQVLSGWSDFWRDLRTLKKKRSFIQNQKSKDWAEVYTFFQ